MIRSYLARNVLDELPEQRRRFLVLTCGLGLLTGELCDELLETTGSAAVLEELERDQVFTGSLDDGLSFRYHEVLQRHLEITLMQDRGVDGARQWHARCAQLLERHGAIGEALRAYLLAEDWHAVSRLVRTEPVDAANAVASGVDVMLPAHLLRDDPWIVLADARRQMRHGAVRDAVAGFARAEALLDEPQFRRVCRDERLAAQIWLPSGESAQAPSWVQRLRAVADGDPRTAGGSAYAAHDQFVAGVEALLVKRYSAAAGSFAAATIAARDASFVRLAAELGSVLAELGLDRRDDCLSRLEEITVDASAAGYAWLERLTRGLLAAVLAVTSAAPWRMSACAELLLECDVEGDEWGAALLQLASAVASALLADEEAGSRFADAVARLRDLRASAVAGWAERLDLHPRQGNPVADSVTASRRVRITCFGRFRVVADGAELDLSELRPRALALLRLLAVEYGRPLHRERLIDTFWPGADLSVGSRRLQVAVSSIRHGLHTLGPDVVLRNGDTYVLHVPTAEVDVCAFEDLLTAASRASGAERISLRTRALDLYVDDLLPEDGAAEHMVGERVRLRLAAAGAAHALARDLAAANDRDAAVQAARRSIELDRYQDAAWELLSDVLAEMGDETAASRVRLDHDHVRAELAEESVGAGVTFATMPISHAIR